jgi:hypothetical protein
MRGVAIPEFPLDIELIIGRWALWMLELNTYKD